MSQPRQEDKDGVPAIMMLDEMTALDARRQTLEAELAPAAPDNSVRLHPSLADACRSRVRELVVSLADAEPEHSLEAHEAIRVYVDPVVLRRSPEDRHVPVVDLDGALAGPPALVTAREGGRPHANKAAPLPEAALQSVLVAGDRIQRRTYVWAAAPDPCLLVFPSL